MMNGFEAYVNPVFCVIGMISNLISMAVFYKCKAKESSGSVQYLSVMAVCDFWNSFRYGFDGWLEFGLEYITNGHVVINLQTSSTVVCKILRFTYDAVTMMSSWTLVFFSAERCLAVCWPLKIAGLVTNKGRKISLVILCVIVITLQSKTIIFYDAFTIRGNGHCYWSPSLGKIIKLSLSIFEKVLLWLLPCFLITVFNAAIIITILRRRKMLGKMTNKMDAQVMSVAELRCIMNLVGISIVFVVSSLPPTILWTYYNYVDLHNSLSAQQIVLDWKKIFRWANFGDSCMIINYAFNFVIYNISLDFYRQTVLGWITCRPRDEKRSSSLDSKTATSNLSC